MMLHPLPHSTVLPRWRTCDAALRPNFELAARKALVQKLAESSLTAQDARRCGMRALTAYQAREEFNSQLSYHAQGIVIPYFDLKGEQNGFYRYRLLGPPLEQRPLDRLADKPYPKYLQPTRSANHVYFCPLWQGYRAEVVKQNPSLKTCTTWPAIAETVAAAIVITEGEFKAACAVKHGIPRIGLGGVWSFRNKQHQLLEALQEFCWSDGKQGRDVYVCYDSDSASNWQVHLAQNEIAREVHDRGAVVRLCELPHVGPQKKSGLDDVLEAHGPEFVRQEVLEKALPYRSDLGALNAEFMYVEDPGMVLRCDTQQVMKSADFKITYGNRKYRVEVAMPNGGNKTVERKSACEWLEWPHRATVNKLSYLPGGEELIPSSIPGVKPQLNLWPGWGVEPERGDTKPWDDLLNFLLKDEAPANRRWFEQWLAYPIQHPARNSIPPFFCG